MDSASIQWPVTTGHKPTVLKTGPDRSVRPVQPGANPVRLKPPKPVKNRKTDQKSGKNWG